MLLVLPDHTYRAHAFLSACQGLEVEVLLAVESASTLAARHPERELVIDLGEPERAGELAWGRAQQLPIDAVIPADEAAVLTAAAVAARLGLGGNPVAAVAATRNKLLLRRRLGASGFESPHWAAWEEGTSPPLVRFPCVVKPIDQAASRGVIRADDPPELEAAGRRVRAMIRVAPGCAPREGEATLLVEEFVPGPEVALEGLFWGGSLQRLAVYDKPDPLDGPFFEETIYTVPSQLDPAVLDQAWEVVERACAALSLRFGAIHAEARLGSQPPVLIDLASRSIGGRCSRVLQFRCGLSLEALIVAAALGGEVPDLRLVPEARGVLMIPVPSRGRLQAVPGRARAADLPGVERIEFTIPLGGEVLPWPEGDRYLGFVFARGSDPRQVSDTLRQAQSILGVVVTA